MPRTPHPNKVSASSAKRRSVSAKNARNRASGDTYEEYGIEWLAGVDVDFGGIYYWHIDQYSQIPGTSFAILKYPPNRKFPENPDIQSYTELMDKQQWIKDSPSNTMGSLTEFLCE